MHLQCGQWQGAEGNKSPELTSACKDTAGWKGQAAEGGRVLSVGNLTQRLEARATMVPRSLPQLKNGFMEPVKNNIYAELVL